MKEFKDLLKKDLVKNLNVKYSNDRRVETICRAIINRRSYDFHYSGESIYLEKDGKKIVIEQADRKNNDGNTRIYLAERAKNLVDALLADEEAIRNYRSAV